MLLNSLNNNFVKLFLKDFSLKSQMEQNSPFFRSHFHKIELDKIFEEYAQVQQMRASQKSPSSRESVKRVPDSRLYYSSLEQFHSKNPNEIEALGENQQKGNYSAKHIRVGDKSFEINQWKSYKTLLSKGEMGDTLNGHRGLKLPVNRKLSEFVNMKDSFKKKASQENVDQLSANDIGISVKKVEKDSMIELSMNETVPHQTLGNSKLTDGQTHHLSENFPRLKKPSSYDSRL